MPRFPYRLALILTGPEDKDLGQHAIEPDWVPVRESIQFELLRRDGMNATPIGEEDFSLAPLFSAESGEPWIEGVTAVIADSKGLQLSLDFPNAAFVRPASRLLSARMVAEKKVEAGDLITYRTVAFPIGEVPTPIQSTFTEVALLPAIHEIVSFEATFPGAVKVEIDAGDDAAEPFPIVVPHDLLEEIKATSEAADTVETGGLLLGRLLRYADNDTHRLTVEVAAQIPAQHTEASSTSLRFTDETWAATHHALRLRRSAGDSHATEIVVGWWHSHPARTWCPESCPLENRLTCPKQAPFFSSDDLSLHREVFPKAHHLALLVNVADAGTTVSAYAADRGVVSQVPYHIIPPKP